MRHTLKRSLIILLALLLLALPACAAEPARGESAYEIAVRNGFAGTEAEWLDSLVVAGESAYEIAVRNGFTGTEAEWLASLAAKEAPAPELRILQQTVSIVSKYTVSGGTFTVSGGSGVILALDREKGDALILTNNHVVYRKDADAADRRPDRVYVYLYGAETFLDCTDGGSVKYALVGGAGDTGAIPATVVGGSQRYDIALLRVTRCETLKTADCAAVTPAAAPVFAGDEVYAVGNAVTAGLSVTRGIVSVDCDSIEMTSSDGTRKQLHRVIRVDAAINSGNSGGGLYNAAGEFVGLVCARASDTKIQNIGYAFPLSLVTGVADRLLTAEAESRAADEIDLGVTFVGINGKSEREGGTGRVFLTETVTVKEITAAESPLIAGDVFRTAALLRAGETVAQLTLSRSFEITDLLLFARVGDTVVLTGERGGAPLTVRIPVTAEMSAPLY